MSKYNRDLEITVKGQSRSSNVVPFDTLGMISYQCSIVTLSVGRTFFEIFNFKYAVTLKTGLWSVIENVTIRQSAYDFLLTFRSNHGPIWYLHNLPGRKILCDNLRIDGDFCRKSQNFPTTLYFVPPLKGFPLKLGTGDGSAKTRINGATGPTKKFDDNFSHVDRMPLRYRQTDGRTRTGQQQRPRLRIASRGKNVYV